MPQSQQSKPKVYYGCFIERKTSPGHQLPWSTYCNGRFLYADTLAGIKELIRYELKKTAS